MKAKIKSLFLTGLPVALTALLLAVVFAWAWVEPTQGPPNGNVPAPINVGPSSQTKQGSLGLNTKGEYETGLLVINNAYFIGGKVGIGTTEPSSKLTVEGGIRITGTSSYLKLPSLTTAERDALTPEYGMMIYNTDSKRAEIYIPEGWSRLGAPLPLPLGEPCDSASDCASGYCVDGVCCDSACNDKVCQRCDAYSINGAGHCGYVSSSSADPDNECGTSGCGTGYCKGDSYACGYYTSGQHNCPICQACTGSGECANVSECENCYGCTGPCKWCSDGHCYICSVTGPNAHATGMRGKSGGKCRPSNTGYHWYGSDSAGCSSEIRQCLDWTGSEEVWRYNCSCSIYK